MRNLKTCPFCGKDVKMEIDEINSSTLETGTIWLSFIIRCSQCGCWYKEIYAKCDGIKCKCPECGTMADGVDKEAYDLYLQLVGKSIFEE